MGDSFRGALQSALRACVLAIFLAANPVGADIGADTKAFFFSQLTPDACDSVGVAQHERRDFQANFCVEWSESNAQAVYEKRLGMKTRPYQQFLNEAALVLLVNDYTDQCYKKAGHLLALEHDLEHAETSGQVAENASREVAPMLAGTIEAASGFLIPVELVLQEKEKAWEVLHSQAPYRSDREFFTELEHASTELTQARDRREQAWNAAILPEPALAFGKDELSRLIRESAARPGAKPVDPADFSLKAMAGVLKRAVATARGKVASECTESREFGQALRQGEASSSDRDKFIEKLVLDPTKARRADELIQGIVISADGRHADYRPTPNAVLARGLCGLEESYFLGKASNVRHDFWKQAATTPLAFCGGGVGFLFTLGMAGYQLGYEVPKAFDACRDLRSRFATKDALALDEALRAPPSGKGAGSGQAEYEADALAQCARNASFQAGMAIANAALAGVSTAAMAQSLGELRQSSSLTTALYEGLAQSPKWAARLEKVAELAGDAATVARWGGRAMSGASLVLAADEVVEACRGEGTPQYDAERCRVAKLQAAQAVVTVGGGVLASKFQAGHGPGPSEENLESELLAEEQQAGAAAAGAGSSTAIDPVKLREALTRSRDGIARTRQAQLEARDGVETAQRGRSLAEHQLGEAQIDLASARDRMRSASTKDEKIQAETALDAAMIRQKAAERAYQKAQDGVTDAQTRADVLDSMARAAARQGFRMQGMAAARAKPEERAAADEALLESAKSLLDANGVAYATVTLRDGAKGIQISPAPEDRAKSPLNAYAASMKSKMGEAITYSPTELTAQGAGALHWSGSQPRISLPHGAIRDVSPADVKALHEIGHAYLTKALKDRRDLPFFGSVDAMGAKTLSATPGPYDHHLSFEELYTYPLEAKNLAARIARDGRELKDLTARQAARTLDRDGLERLSELTANRDVMRSRLAQLVHGARSDIFQPALDSIKSALATARGGAAVFSQPGGGADRQAPVVAEITDANRHRIRIPLVSPAEVSLYHQGKTAELRAALVSRLEKMKSITETVSQNFSEADSLLSGDSVDDATTAAALVAVSAANSTVKSHTARTGN